MYYELRLTPKLMLRRPSVLPAWPNTSNEVVLPLGPNVSNQAVEKKKETNFPAVHAYLI
jgi:hypothetical protein